MALARRVNPQSPKLNTMQKRERAMTITFIIAMPILFYITTVKTLSDMNSANCALGIIAACQK